jgi:septal ring factor EnvC (AmiA/AmiB activator)
MTRKLVLLLGAVASGLGLLATLTGRKKDTIENIQNTSEEISRISKELKDLDQKQRELAEKRKNLRKVPSK